MGYNCRCKNCGTDFVDMYGEFCDEDDKLVCPICDNTDLWVYDEIPNYETTFNPIYFDNNIDKLRKEYETRQGL